MQQLQYIREHAHRRYIGIGTRTLNDKRCSRIPVRGERDDVIASLRGCEWMILGYLSETPAWRWYPRWFQHTGALHREVELFRVVAAWSYRARQSARRNLL